MITCSGRRHYFHAVQGVRCNLCLNYFHQRSLVKFFWKNVKVVIVCTVSPKIENCPTIYDFCDQTVSFLFWSGKIKVLFFFKFSFTFISVRKNVRSLLWAKRENARFCVDKNVFFSIIFSHCLKNLWLKLFCSFFDHNLDRTNRNESFWYWNILISNN